MDNDLISIVVPIYNVEKYLDKCIESIVNQTYKNLEIILVDDGSPDSCPQICDKWAETDSRIKVVHKENCGTFKARISGIDAATGKYIAFIDGDDWLTADAVQYLYGLLMKTPNCQIATSQFTITKEILPVIENPPETIEVLDFTNSIKKIDEYNLWSMCGKLYERKLFDNLKIFEENYEYSEDLITNYNVLMKVSRVVSSNQNKYVYFRHSDSAMGVQLNQERVEGHLKAYELLADSLNENTMVYKYHMANRIKNDLRLINEIVIKDLSSEVLKIVKNDLKKCLKYVYDKDNDYCFNLKHKLGILLLFVSSKVYKKILINRN